MTEDTTDPDVTDMARRDRHWEGLPPRRAAETLRAVFWPEPLRRLGRSTRRCSSRSVTALRTCQSSAERLLTELYDRWYSAFRTMHKGIAGPLTASQALRAHKTRNYIDVLFLHERI
jgi:hypothetical protein